MKIEYTTTTLQQVFGFWVKQYKLPEGTHLHGWEWFVNQKSGEICFKLYIADGPDPFADLRQ